MWLCIPSVVLVLYFFVGFEFGFWHHSAHPVLPLAVAIVCRSYAASKVFITNKMK